MKPKFIKKYMRLAKFVAKDQPVCPSRQVGAVIVDPILNKVVGTGYNGPPPGTPHTDSRIYLEEYLWPLLTNDDIVSIGLMYKNHDSQEITKTQFIDEFAGKGKCPRRILNVPSGRKMNLCTCGHAEVNAIINAAQNLNGCEMFLWETSPCVPCAHAIIMARISTLHCFKGNFYANEANWLLEQAKITIHRYSQEWIFDMERNI